MRKVILNFTGLYSREAVHEYIAQQMGFPHYYGRNLDALFDCLTDIAEPTAVGCYFPDGDELRTEQMEEELQEVRWNRMKEYLEKLQETFLDAEEENRNLAVFIGKILG